MDFYFRRWSLQLGLFAAAVGSAIISFSFANTIGNNAQAQVVPDNTLGSENSAVTNTGNVDTISGGATRGANLFHSFEQFSVQNGRTAQFNNAASIQNIITRVTGGSISNIDGTLAAGGTANLFLLNPNGIVFGQNARLDIGGSFIGTTASSINFADGTQFSATPATGAPLLTVSVPLGLQFGTGAGSIINRSTSQGLQVQPGRTLGLVGGNVNLEGGNLTARGGRVELGAVAAPGVVGLNTDNNSFRFSFPTNLALADISLTNTALVDVRAGGGGSIAVNARNLNLAGGSAIVAGIEANSGATDAQAGDIDINAQGIVAINGVGSFPDGIFSSGIFNNVNQGGTGKGGNISIKTGSLSLADGGVISTSTFGQGNTGNVTIDVGDTLSISEVRSVETADGIKTFPSGIFSTVEQLPEGLQGDRQAGEINIRARSLSLSNGARVSASTFGQGDAGSISITTDDRISLDSSLIFNIVGQTGTGKSGNIAIRGRSLSLTNDALVSTSTFGQGDAGSISITTDDRISLDNSSIFTNVGSREVTTPVTGNVGNIQIKARTVSLANGAQIQASFLPNARQQGNPGVVLVEATDSISFAGINNNGNDSGIFTDVESGAVANGSNIEISAPVISLSNAALNASAAGQGNAGNIKVQVQDSVFLDNSLLQSNVGSREATTPVTGNVGNIQIKAKTVSLANGAQIQASFLPNARQQKNSDVVSLEATDSISLAGSGIFTDVESGAVANGSNIEISAPVISFDDTFLDARSAGQGNAGNVNVTAGDRISLDNSRVVSTLRTAGIGKGGDVILRARSISIANGTQTSTPTLGQGDAGNIRVDATDDISISGSTLSLFSSGNGNAGDLIINAGDRIFLDNSTVSSELFPAGRGKGGDVRIQARSLSLINGALLSTSTFGQGNAGNINISVDDAVTFAGVNEGIASGVYTSVVAGAEGRAGDIEIEARSLSLDTGVIDAATASGDGGNIRLQATNNLRLRNGSRISTSAGGTEQPGNGGNITIDSPLVIANFNGNNDITANAFRGSGGRIEINAQSIFGLTPRSRQELQSLLGTDTPTANDLLNALNNSPSNDVAAISLSDPALSGTVSFNAADIDPSRDIVELPTGLVDASTQVAAGCSSGAENRFVVTGGGGLPPTPGDKLSVDAILTDWASLPADASLTAVESSPEAANTTSNLIIEANSWQFTSKGEVVLTANTSNTPYSFGVTPTSCSGS